MPDLYTKPELLEHIRASRAALDAVLARFSAAEMARAYPPDEWSVQDVLAHITFWEAYALDRLREAASGQAPRLLGELAEADLNRINAEALAAGRANSLAAVQAAYARVHGELLAAVEALPEAADAPFWALWPDAETPWLVVQNNTADHYDEHRIQVQGWLAGGA